MTESRLPGIYNLPLPERRRRVVESASVSEATAAALERGLTADQAEPMIENVIGVFGLPLGVAVNFQVNGRDVLVPMAIEEPSVVAGASFMARLAREGGGFEAGATEPEMIAQLQVLDVVDLPAARRRILDQKSALMAEADQVDPVLQSLGGGARDLQVHILEETPIGPQLIVHLIYDVRDAMGANAANTAAERLAPRIASISAGRVHLRILSNLADRRRAHARCRIPVDALAFGEFSGDRVARGIIEAWAFAAADPYRAATHNKGIMNGIDAVVIATGNDWRAVEAGAHAYAARDGRYTSLSHWSIEAGHLVGALELPLAVGIVGGATRVHPTARACLDLMGVHTARELAEIIASVGLAQNLAALRALATEGIQRGHMSLHARQVAIAAGAQGPMIDAVAQRMVEEGVVRVDRAEALIREWSTDSAPGDP